MKILQPALLQSGYSANIMRVFTPEKHTANVWVKGTIDRVGKEKIEKTITAHKKNNNVLVRAKTKIKLEGHGSYEMSCRNCDQSA